MKKYILDIAQYKKLARQAAAESCVLLKNDEDTLPIKKGSRVSIFGRSAFHYYKSGTGSGGMVNTPYVVGILDGLVNEGNVILNEKLKKHYEDWIEENPFDRGEGWGLEPWSQKEMPLSEETVAEACKESELALVIIGRTAGEDQDTLAEPGSYMLTKTEEDMLEKVCRIFPKTAVILNTGNIIDMKWAQKYNPSAILYVWQGGQEGGSGVADVLCGRVSPCGKLTDTIAKNIEDYPSTENFGDRVINYYAEDIYVGYRYFETFAKDKVLYPFGFGLTYTSFQIETTRFLVIDDKLLLDVSVRNTGNYSAKEVIQVYSSAPQGKLGKPARELKAYEKTEVLNKGEVCVLKFCIPIKDLSSYDDGGITGHKACNVLESGIYKIYVGEDVRSASFAGEFVIDETRVTEVLEEAMAPQKSFERLRPIKGENGFDKAYEAVPRVTVKSEEKRVKRIPSELDYLGDLGYVLSDVKNGKITMDMFIAQLDDEALTCIVRGEGMCSPKVTPGTASAFGGVTEKLAAFGIPIACCSDGPSGIRMDNGAQAFSLPNGTALGCTFNPRLIEELYKMEGIELRKNRIDVLLGPGMNIHRSPLNGRNFEYISEDPFVTGTIAAAQVRGLAYSNVIGTVKHFAANNQEHYRREADSAISERALREIYLKGFEIAVKDGYVKSVMTTYGAVNGIWTAGSYDLVTAILRDEWGFEGIVMTDWWADINEEGIAPSRQNTGAMVRAQNDLYMVTEDAFLNSQNDNSMEALRQGRTTRGEFQRCAKNICNILMETPAMEALQGKSLETIVEAAGEEAMKSRDLLNNKHYELTEKTYFDINKISACGGNSESFRIKAETPGDYEFAVLMRAEAAELAQMSLSVFCDEQFKGTINIKGVDKELREYTIDIGHLCNEHIVRIYFSMDGIRLGEMSIRKK